jgi:predicted AAA+ superfamily ATPase
LDQKELLDLAQKKPGLFLQEHSQPLQAIDECQLSPMLFPALKEFVRTHKAPGQFLLSGSVRFTSRKAIRESLTGRIVNFELLPFSISEIAHKELPDTLATVMSTVSMDRVAQSLMSQSKFFAGLGKEYSYYFDHGGLPGVCFIRDENLRNLRIKEQLQTILDRDLRLVYPTNLPYTQILDFLKFIATHQGQTFSYAEASKTCGISDVTQKKILNALEAVFLIRRIPIEGTSSGQVFYLEDQAEAKYLADYKMSPKDEFEHLIYRNLRTQFYYKLGSSFREFHFLTRGGSRIPYAIEQGPFILGILPIQDESPNRSESASAASFLKKYGNARILYLHQGKTIQPIDERSISAPVFYFV